MANIACSFLEERTAFTTRQGTTLPLDYSLDKLAQQLNPCQFFRVSRQYVVSLNATDTVHAYSVGRLKLELRPAARHEVLVSGDWVADFKQWLGS